MESVSNKIVIECEGKNVSVMYFFIKRVIDIIGSLLGLIILSPVFLVIGILIKIEDPTGPIFYSHKRVGKDGNIIPVYKFRSMFQNADQMIKNFTPEQKKEFSENFKLKNDPRITKIGSFIRKTSLDELPQLLNVLKGEMTIVGPRPITAEELDKYGKYKAIYLLMDSGLTGMWQAYGRSDTSYEERVQMDVHYYNNRSLILDFKIIIGTVVSVIKGKGAY
ncbi:sugar transferase [Turicibacter sanguinis]|uniref:sugar transferase n=1 Tax=Turicibacter sanguinis TaxID=154288 RepID=UPI0018A8AD96|nr:sugar transferase [Turicibacter sanguinis]MDB8558556.1 sugar transferase [Turicibacter sanguinis]MDB8561352.1 sugar transferase [Turicibacter sanguinis]